MRLRLSHLMFLLATLSLGSASAERVSVNPIQIKFNNQIYKGDVYSLTGVSGKKPGVVIAHELWGKGEFEDRHARKLVELGYVVLVADLYGQGKNTKKAAVAESFLRVAESSGMDRLFDLVDRTVSTFGKLQNVDSTKVAIIGFGWGGGIAFNAAKRGYSDLKAAVIFYGGMKRVSKLPLAGVSTSILYINPKNDAYNSQKTVENREIEMLEGHSDFKIFTIENAQYGFMQKGIDNWGRDRVLSMSYNAQAEKKAWDETLKLLDKKLKPKKPALVAGSPKK